MPIPSLFIGSGAISAQQDAISVIANNIANVNTVAFKGSRVTFQELAGQVLRNGSSSTATLGGINPVEIGNGVRVGSVSTVFGQGAIKSTGVATNLAIQGNSFFVVSSASNGSTPGIPSPEYTRDGNFNFDSSGFLVNSEGLKVFGATFYNFNTEEVKSIPNYSTVTYVSDQAVGTSIPAPIDPVAAASITATPFAGGSAPSFDLTAIAEMSVRGGLISSTAVAAGDLTVSADANGNMVFMYDEGNAGPGVTQFTATVDPNQTFTDNSLTLDMANNAGDTIQLRIRLNPGVTSLNSVFASVDFDTVTATSDTLVFGLAGAATTGAGGAVVGATDITIAADDMPFVRISDLDGLYEPIRLPPFFFALDPSIQKETTAFNIESDGTITVVDDASNKMRIGRLALATFNNPDGLVNASGNKFRESANSGAAAISVLDGPANANGPSLNNNKIISGSLEGSNVNLANEFSELIGFQRGLQASARTITTSSEILQTIINL